MREVTKVSQECLRKPVGTDYNYKLHFQYIIITKNNIYHTTYKQMVKCCST